jgi:hypothetical protein
VSLRGLSKGRDNGGRGRGVHMMMFLFTSEYLGISSVGERGAAVMCEVGVAWRPLPYSSRIASLLGVRDMRSSLSH